MVYPKHPADPRQSFPEPHELELGPLHVEIVESGERARDHLPTVGYLITHSGKQVSFFHTGDLHDAYRVFEHLEGRVDFLIHAKVGINLYRDHIKGWSFYEFLDSVRPRFMIPIHYGTDRASDPIPDGYWPPDIDDVNAWIKNLEEQAEGLTTILPFTAGKLYEVALPEKKVKWKWRRYDTWDWDHPPWVPEGYYEKEPPPGQ